MTHCNDLQTEQLTLAEATRETILIVDDEPTNVFLLKRTLEQEYRVISAMSGQEGLDMAKEHLPDLILLDVMMPGMGGHEVCRRLMDDPLTCGIPIIFLTALDEQEDELQGLSLGAVDYITKPFNLALTRARIRSQINNHKFHKLKAELASMDGLTGLANRPYFDHRYETEWRRARRTGKPLALVLADVDHFQSYNEFHGHIAGDACLRQVAAQAAALLRRPADLAARYGGDEFVLLLPETDEEGAGFLAETLRCQVDEMLVALPDSAHGRVTLTCGVVALVPGRDDHPQFMLAQADRVLNSAKAEGRNRVRRLSEVPHAAEDAPQRPASREHQDEFLIESIVAFTGQQDQRSLDHGLAASLHEMLQPELILGLEIHGGGKERYTVFAGDEPVQLPEEVSERASQVSGLQFPRIRARGMTYLLAAMDEMHSNVRRVLVLGLKDVSSTDFHERMFMGMVRVYQNFVRLMREGEKDTLTGLQNRRTLENALNSLLASQVKGRRSSDQDQGAALAVLDLDKFKRINDTFGHLIGDEVLLLFSQILRDSLRDNDYPYRYGGEEFIVILRGVTEEDAGHVLERIRRNVEERDFPQVGRVTVSIGYTFLDGQALPTQVIEEADRALYFAKEHGRNQVRCYSALPADEQIDPSHGSGDIELF